MTPAELSLAVSCLGGAVGVMWTVANTSRKVGAILEDMAHMRTAVDEVRGDVKEMKTDLIALKTEHSLVMTSGGCGKLRT